MSTRSSCHKSSMNRISYLRLEKCFRAGLCSRFVLIALLNDLLDELNVELHLPTFNYCGSGARLAERLARGDKGINELDNFKKEHDISYSKTHCNLNAKKENRIE